MSTIYIHIHLKDDKRDFTIYLIFLFKSKVVIYIYTRVYRFDGARAQHMICSNLFHVFYIIYFTRLLAILSHAAATYV